MTITNGYCTLDEAKREAAIESLDILDDDVLERCIEDASRAVDNHCAKQFYAASATYSYSCPTDGDRVLWLNEPWLSVSSITNGDATSVAASSYNLWPLNAVSKVAVRLKDSASISWQPTSTGDYVGAIAISGSTGYVNRGASDAKSTQIISNTKRATIITALAYYRKRFGVGAEAVQVTAAGVVLSPQGLPRDAAELLEGYMQ